MNSFYKQKYLIGLLGCLAIITYAISRFSVHANVKIDKKEKIIYIERPEVEPRFLILNPKQIYFCSNTGETFKLMELNCAQQKTYAQTDHDLFRPFIFEGKVYALTDNNGDENFITTSEKLNAILNHRSIQEIFSFRKGRLLLVQLKDDSNLYKIDYPNKKSTIIHQSVHLLNSIVFEPKNSRLIIDHDSKLDLIDLNDLKKREIFSNPGENKFNPFIDSDTVFFSSSFESNYKRIYKIDVKDTHSKPIFVLGTNHDVRLPKTKDHNLYFVEVSDGEYLLKEYSLRNGKTSFLTSSGVVYNYDFLGDDNILFSFSDWRTPKSIRSLNYHNRALSYLGESPSKVDYKIKFISPDSNRSPAFLMTADSCRIKKGIILFLHPGIHDDFSPRWESVLINLCLNGYDIIATNYPMSSGYGKSYSKSNIQDCIMDIENWKEHLLSQYKTLPFYLISSSSSNTILENYLSVSGKDVTGFISLFGIPTGKIPSTAPGLYILGVNDPIISFSKRAGALELAKKNGSKLRILSFKNEGHWFRKGDNIQHAISQILNFLSETANR